VRHRQTVNEIKIMNNLNGSKEKAIDGLSGAATPNPRDLPVGSVESRAAARAIVDSRKENETPIQIVLVSPDGSQRLGPLILVPGV
jgi:hypothetical protein